MKEVIEVNNMKYCIPKKGVWYNYYGTIFISAMRQPNSYIRRKSIIKDGKKDNELSEWHFDWQYNKIESKYGFEKYGEKSFERTINVDDENHRIDSVVENLAIEFQYTLSVDIEEMNTRYNAHSKYDYIPYLVVDFTKYSIDEFKSYLEYGYHCKLSDKLEKWLKCNYAKSNNLFIDLNDGIYRVITAKNIDSYLLQKETFINNLLLLENDLTDKINHQSLIDERDRIKAKYLKRREEVERLNKKAKKAKELKDKQKQVEVLNWEVYLKHKSNSNEFSSYRKCSKNPIITPFIQPYEKLTLSYSFESVYEGKILKESHIYLDSDNIYSLVINVCFSEKRVEKPISTGFKIDKKKEQLKTIILFKKNNEVEAEIHWLKGGKPQIINKNELTLF